MKFKVPHTSNFTEAEDVLNSVAAFVGRPVPPPGERIRRVSYRHNGQDFEVQVGDPIPAYYMERGEPVIAIFGGEPLLVCLPSRGVLHGDPILVGAPTVKEVEYFDPE